MTRTKIQGAINKLKIIESLIMKNDPDEKLAWVSEVYSLADNATVLLKDAQTDIDAIKEAVERL